MLRFFFVLVMVAALAVSAYGAASALNVQGGTVQAGSDTTLACAKDPVKIVAWAANTYAGPYDGLDWITVQLSQADSERCAGNDLTGRLALSDGTFSYAGAYWGGFGGKPAVTSVVPIVSGTTEYKLGLWKADWATKDWVDPEKVISVKLWLGGPANVDD